MIIGSVDKTAETQVMVKLTDINEKIGEYDVSHANDMSLLDEGITLMRTKLSK